MAKKKRPRKRIRNPRHPEYEDRFNVDGMSPLFGIELRTPIGRPAKLNFHYLPCRHTFEGCCRFHCTESEIAANFGLEVPALHREVERFYGEPFRTVYARLKSEGLISLRRAQWLTAVRDRVPSMMVWLGKNELGQRDKFELPEVPAPVNEEGEEVERMVIYVPKLVKVANPTAEPKPNPDARQFVSDH